MRVVAILAAYNERRFIEPCLRHLNEQGIDSYLIDNCSTDDTPALAEGWFGRGLIDIESFPRGEGDTFNWNALLTRKEELAQELDADWFMHLDPDEFRLPPADGQTLAQAIEAVDRAGFNAVNFNEFTFVPTREHPDHDHANFQHTMHTYYPFRPKVPHKLAAWKRCDSVSLAWSGGHKVRLPNLRMNPKSFPMKHYLFLSVPHAIEKFVQRNYDQDEVDSGWHIWRSKLSASDILLPSRSELRIARTGVELDPSNPRKRHHLAEAIRA